MTICLSFGKHEISCQGPNKQLKSKTIFLKRKIKRINCSFFLSFFFSTCGSNRMPASTIWQRKNRHREHQSRVDFNAAIGYMSAYKSENHVTRGSIFHDVTLKSHPSRLGLLWTESTRIRSETKAVYNRVFKLLSCHKNHKYFFRFDLVVRPVETLL